MQVVGGDVCRTRWINSGYDRVENCAFSSFANATFRCLVIELFQCIADK